MNQEIWTEVDHYIDDIFVPSDTVLNDALKESDYAGLPPIHVAPNQGKLLAILAKAVGAHNILEIGTLAGYSTIWLARILPRGGRLVTLESNGSYANVARANIYRAGFQDVVDIRVAAALDSLMELAKEKRDPFDFIFIDADKRNNAAYFDWALKLARIGSLIVFDNVIRNASILCADGKDESVIGAREGNAAIGSNPRVMATAIQTVGCKGYDGFAIALVTGA